MALLRVSSHFSRNVGPRIQSVVPSGAVLAVPPKERDMTPQASTLSAMDLPRRHVVLGMGVLGGIDGFGYCYYYIPMIFSIVMVFLCFFLLWLWLLLLCCCYDCWCACCSYDYYILLQYLLLLWCLLLLWFFLTNCHCYVLVAVIITICWPSKVVLNTDSQWSWRPCAMKGRSAMMADVSLRSLSGGYMNQ